jgi:putative zinc finger/helix-turn-helix YgiT family protein
MMSETESSPMKHDRPFPWRCVNCRAKEVVPQPTDHSADIAYDGKVYTIRIPDLVIPICGKCGAKVFGVGDDDRIREALRAQVGLLAPQQIAQGRARLAMTQQELSEQLGVSVETVVRWEAGGIIQSRALDNLLRVFFESEEARRLLRGRLSMSRQAG